MRTSSRSGALPVFIVLLFSLSACIQSGRGTAEAVPLQPGAFPQTTSAIQTVTLLTATPAAPVVTLLGPASTRLPTATGEPATAGQWLEYRDPAYGFGLAIPCWWPYAPIPAGGSGGTLTLRSYDDAFFQANSTKGWWTSGDWPEGALKIDVTAWQDFNPTLETLEAFKTSFDPLSSEIAAVQEVQVGANQALLVEMRNLVNTADPNSRLYIFRPQDNLLLMVSAAPDRALDTSDVQAILGSLALTASQPVSLPQFTPSPAIIPLPAGCEG